MPKARRLIPLSEDVVEELRRVADRTGIPVPQLVDNMLSSVSRLLAARTDISSALTEAAIAVELRRLNILLLPFNAIVDVLSLVDEKAYTTFAESMEEFAETLAAMVRARGVEAKGLEPLLALLVPGVTLSVVEEPNGGRIVAAITDQPNDRSLDLVTRIIKAVLRGFGFKPLTARIEAGVVTVVYALEGAGGGRAKEESSNGGRRAGGGG